MKKETVRLIRNAMNLREDLKEYVDNKTPISLKSLISTLYSEYSNCVYILDNTHGEKIDESTYKESGTLLSFIYNRHYENKICIIADVIEDDKEIVGGNDIELQVVNKSKHDPVDLINDIVIITDIYYQGTSRS